MGYESDLDDEENTIDDYVETEIVSYINHPDSQSILINRNINFYNIDMFEIERFNVLDDMSEQITDLFNEEYELSAIKDMIYTSALSNYSIYDIKNDPEVDLNVERINDLVENLEEFIYELEGTESENLYVTLLSQYKSTLNFVLSVKYSTLFYDYAYDFDNNPSNLILNEMESVASLAVNYLDEALAGFFEYKEYYSEFNENNSGPFKNILTNDYKLILSQVMIDLFDLKDKLCEYNLLEDKQLDTSNSQSALYSLIEEMSYDFDDSHFKSELDLILFAKNYVKLFKSMKNKSSISFLSNEIDDSIICENDDSVIYESIDLPNKYKITKKDIISADAFQIQEYQIHMYDDLLKLLYDCSDEDIILQYKSPNSKKDPAKFDGTLFNQLFYSKIQKSENENMEFFIKDQMGLTPNLELDDHITSYWIKSKKFLGYEDNSDKIHEENYNLLSDLSKSEYNQ